MKRSSGVITLTWDKDRSFQDLIKEAGIYFPMICGGRGSCGKCRIRVIDGDLAVATADREFLSAAEIEDGWRLACSAAPADSVTIEIPEKDEKGFESVAAFGAPRVKPKGAHAVKLSSATSGKNGSDMFGIAVDIGTTTISCALVDMNTGSVADLLSEVNRQRQFGADVISRIQSANDGKLEDMRDSVRNQMELMSGQLAERNGLSPDKISKMTVAGNTTMLHVLLGLSCGTLGHTPFTPVTLDAMTIDSGELFEWESSFTVDILPGISTYVGADIVSGIFYLGLHDEENPVVLMDIGTNGEIALVSREKIVCAATAAGPAFEGGNILWGTGSVPGAISSVKKCGEVYEVGTIGGEEPIGICGSGVVDAIWSGLDSGDIKNDGRFNVGSGITQLALAKTGGGEHIVLTQKDVRELQLAKSAIRSGLEAILRQSGVSSNDISACFLAGGFGYHLDIESSIGIGLIPAEWKNRAYASGNTSLGGAVACLLTDDWRPELAKICAKSKEWSLPDDPWFGEAFIDNLRF